MPALPKAMVADVVKGGMSARAEVKTPPRFKAGDRVVVRNVNPTSHTRAPRYVRGKQGVVHRHHGGFAFADTRAHGQGDQPQHVYSVRFEARELWGANASPRDALYIDMWESYIEPAK
jgi:nitrile hydratase